MDPADPILQIGMAILIKSTHIIHAVKFGH